MIAYDPKALKILERAYWSPSGWRDPSDRVVLLEDFEYARAHGVMFEPVNLTHDECVAGLLAAKQRVERKDAAAAFLCSLSARVPYLRSAVSSWRNASAVQPHSFIPDTERDMPYHCAACRECGLAGSLDAYENEDVTVFNFERIKWGGVRLHQPLYCMLDLRLFAELGPFSPSPRDVAIFGDILARIAASAPGDAPSQLEKRLKDAFPSNKAERAVVIEILAEIGVLKPGRVRPLRGRGTDWDKVEHWRGEDGYDRGTVEEFFGEFLPE